MYHVLYNPLAASGQGKTCIPKLEELLKGNKCDFKDIRTIEDYSAFFAALAPTDTVVLAGGDGTLNRFFNRTAAIEYSNPLLYYPSGTGNDFRHDVAPEETGLIDMTPYKKGLPTVSVNGEEHLFINGVGYGIDGYCCEVGDKLAAKSDKPVNYTSIAIKGLLFHFKPTNARVTVDGKTYKYKKVWLAPAMHGRYYGGGMMVAPEQDRLNGEGTISTVIMHGSGKLKTLMVFPGIFKGEHIKHDEMVTVHTGHEITVEFDRPTALQIDGETVLGVTKYTARGADVTVQKTEGAKVAVGV